MKLFFYILLLVIISAHARDEGTIRTGPPPVKFDEGTIRTGPPPLAQNFGMSEILQKIKINAVQSGFPMKIENGVYGLYGTLYQYHVLNGTNDKSANWTCSEFEKITYASLFGDQAQNFREQLHKDVFSSMLRSENKDLTDEEIEEIKKFFEKIVPVSKKGKA